MCVKVVSERWCVTKLLSERWCVAKKKVQGPKMPCRDIKDHQSMSLTAVTAPNDKFIAEKENVNRHKT